MKLWLQDNWLRLLAVVMVLGALLSVSSYAYYQVMNWVVAGAGILTAMQAHKQGKFAFKWIFIAVAVVFNPLAPLYLRPSDWQIADMLTALLFILSTFVVRTARAVPTAP